MLSNDKLKFLRNHYELRQVDIADYVGISVSYVKKIEQGIMDPSKEVHDKWLECCRLGIRSKKKAKDL